MTRLLPRSRFIPPGSTTVRHKRSDMVAYAYTNPKGRPAVIIYGGRRTKPDLWSSFSTDAADAIAFDGTLYVVEA